MTKNYLSVEGMKTDQGAIILAERAADHGRMRLILREWGYKESEIQRFLEQPRVEQKLEARRKTDDRSERMPHSV